MSASQWDQWAQGTACPFDGPRAESNEYWDIVAPLTISTLYLSKNQTYRGHCVLILDLRHVIRPDELSPQEWAMFCADLHRAESAIMQAMCPDHINVAALGNVIPHLHRLIVPRYRSDPRWGAPVWTTTLAEMSDTRLSTDERAELIRELRPLLG
jgi:diadenosine tetraphosphate (Ap4A) HIT family hydrolase